MADAEDEVVEEAVEVEADAEQVGGTEKPPIGSPREAAAADAGADAAEDADGTTAMAAAKDGATATTARPPHRTHSSNLTTTTTAGLAAGTWSPGTQAGHALRPGDTRDIRRRQTRTTQWARPTEASKRKSIATAQGTRAMQIG